MKRFYSLLLLGTLLAACNNGEKQQNHQTANDTDQTQKMIKLGPDFNANNAYNNIKTQVEFGPRVPGTEAHKKTYEWLRDQLKAVADTLYIQHTQLTLADKTTKVPCYNLIASFNPSATERYLLLAHWDTRPWADQDFKDKDKPIAGADDGGSGTGVLIEIARLLREQPLPPHIGVDILLVDVEDYGKPQWGEAAYALGAQYWSKNPHIQDYKARAGILLDMVGGRDARFAIEGYSQRYAPHVITDVWGAANDLGYGKYFVYEQSSSFIYDDHKPINEIAGIPTIDIINLPLNTRTGFVSHWHTHEDDLHNIDVNTLKAVGQTLIQYLYSKAAQTQTP